MDGTKNRNAASPRHFTAVGLTDLCEKSVTQETRSVFQTQRHATYSLKPPVTWYRDVAGFKICRERNPGL